MSAARRLARRRARDVADELVVSGPALYEARDHLVRLFVADDADPVAVAALSDERVEVIETTSRIVADLAGVVHAQGVVGVARLPRPSLTVALEAVQRGSGLLVVADGVADPGNAGTLVRTADGAGADAVVLTTGSVDARGAKVVRSSAGSLFHLPVVDRVDPCALVEACARARVRLVGAAADAPVRVHDADLTGRVAVVVGNEAHGLSEVVRGALDLAVAVPMHARPRPGYAGVAESLNMAVSAGVVIYEAARQRASSAAAATSQVHAVPGIPT